MSWLLCACLLVAAAQAQETDPTAVDNGEGPKVVTPSGLIRGLWMETRRGRRFQAYRGIRYAEPPVGELRFKPPKPILQYKEDVDASKEGPACPFPATRTKVDEDCLRINVYTPITNSSKPLPVIFFIHSGGFYVLSGRSDFAGPHYMLEKDVVLVTINYRLGSLGFISTGDEHAPGNNGLKDQVVALRWVQRNIAAFGGDPDLVTITGCSAGSRSVMLHMISPMTKGLFHRGISMSAGLIGKEATETHQRHLAVKQAEILDCPTNSSKVIIDCLKTKTWKELGDSLPKFFEFGPGDPVSLWRPVVEPDFGQERYLTIDPIDAIRDHQMHAVPHMIGQTTMEFYYNAFTIQKNKTLLNKMNSDWEQIAPISFILPKKDAAAKANRLRMAYLNGKQLAVDKATEVGLGNLYGDSITGFPVHRMANLMCRHSPHPVYYYEFAYVGASSHYVDPNTKKPIGAMHHDDELYIFTLNYRFPTIPLTSPDNKMVEKMTALYFNFAKYGDPNPRADTPALSGLSWPAMTPNDRKYLRIGNELKVLANMKEDRFHVWEELYPIQY